MFAGNFAPRGFALCYGQILSISQNSALYTVLGTTYGGNGVTTFALPDLRGRFPLHQGQGPGLSNRDLGEQGGVENVTLTASEIPAHSHGLNATSSGGNQLAPTGNLLATDALGGSAPYKSGNAPNAVMANSSIVSAGGNLPHNNIPPYLALNFIIALEGVFPPQN